MFKIRLRELFYVKFCVLSLHLWIILRPKEYAGVFPYAQGNDTVGV